MAERTILDQSQKQKSIDTLQIGVVDSIVPILLVLCLIAAIVGMVWLSFTRHERFNSTGFDLAINEQIVWNTLNGRPFASSVEVDNSFADHFRPLLAIIVPFYALFQTPKTLLVIQAVVLASAAIPIYALGNLKLKNRWLALVFAAVYLIYPAVGFTARFDFHIEVFVIPAFIAAFYMMETDRWIAASLFLLIPLLSKETMGLSVAAFGLYAILRWRKFNWGAIWLLVGVLMTWGTIFWLIPTVRGEAADSMTRYAWLGNNPAEMVQALIFQPSLWLTHIWTQANLITVLQLILPVGFLALFGWGELGLALPALAINFLAAHFCQSTIYCHYAIPVIPIVFIAAIMGFSRLQKWLSAEQSNIVGSLIILCSLFSFLMWHPFQEVPILPTAFGEIGNSQTVWLALQTIPENGSLSLVTTNDYAPYLAQRQELYIVGIPTQRVAPTDPDLVFLNLYDQQYIVCDQIQDYLLKLDRSRYGATFRTGGVIVLQRDGGDPAIFLDFVQNWNNCAG